MVHTRPTQPKDKTMKLRGKSEEELYKKLDTLEEIARTTKRARISFHALRVSKEVMQELHRREMLTLGDPNAG